MRSEVLFFEASAFFALVLLARHALRHFGRKHGLVLLLYLAAMGFLRELLVIWLTASTGKPHPFAPDASMGSVAGVNFAVVGGWVFTAYTSFLLSGMIQRRSFPRTNVFLTLALTALVTSTVSYAVETSGTRLRLWVWDRQCSPLTWLPFDWPVNAFDGWAATSFVILLPYCVVRYRMFSRRLWVSLLVAVGLFALYALSDLAVGWLGPDSPRMKLTVVYLVAALLLGFIAPEWMLGTSSRELGLAPARLTDRSNKV